MVSFTVLITSCQLWSFQAPNFNKTLRYCTALPNEVLIPRLFGTKNYFHNFWHIINDLWSSHSKLEVIYHERSCNAIHQINLIDVFIRKLYKEEVCIVELLTLRKMDTQLFENIKI